MAETSGWRGAANEPRTSRRHKPSQEALRGKSRKIGWPWPASREILVRYEF
jgi:hypothetical protein